VLLLLLLVHSTSLQSEVKRGGVAPIRLVQMYNSRLNVRREKALIKIVQGSRQQFQRRRHEPSAVFDHGRSYYVVGSFACPIGREGPLCRRIGRCRRTVSRMCRPVEHIGRQLQRQRKRLSYSGPPAHEHPKHELRLHCCCFCWPLRIGNIGDVWTKRTKGWLL
jgi:hypothetical protein